jgi:hypothetical protein
MNVNMSVNVSYRLLERVRKERLNTGKNIFPESAALRASGFSGRVSLRQGVSILCKMSIREGGRKIQQWNEVGI